MKWTSIKLWFDRTISSNGRPQWAIPLLSFAFSFLVFSLILLIVNKGWCLVGNADFAATNSYKPQNVADAAFFHMFTNGGQNLFKSHFWGAVITVVGLFVIAILTSSITNFFEQRAKQYLSGETSYYFKDHIVVFGSSDILYSILEQVFDSAVSGKSYILVQTSKDVEKTRREVFSFLDEKYDKDRIVFQYGDRTSSADVKKLHLDTAKEVYIIGDASEKENGDSYRDAYNIDCIDTIHKILKNKELSASRFNFLRKLAGKKAKAPSKRLLCRIMFEYQTTFSTFQHSNIEPDILNYIDFEPFNFHEMWAQKVLVEGNEKYGYRFLDQTETESYIDEDSEKSVHLIVVGMSKMGVALALEAAQLCHFPNYVTKRIKTRITFIDPEADKEQAFLGGRLHHLRELSKWTLKDASTPGFGYWGTDPSKPSSGQDWLDIEWEFIKGRVEEDSVRKYLAAAACDENHIVTVAVCLPQSHQAIAAALYLPDRVFEKSLQILVYQRISGRVVNQIASNKGGKYRKLKPFGMIDQAFSSSLIDDSKAMKVDYAYGQVYSEFDRLKKIVSEDSQQCEIKLDSLSSSLNWENVDFKLEKFREETYRGTWRKKVVNRWSSRFNANTISVKLRSVKADKLKTVEDLQRVLSENQKILMEMEHNRWNMEKLIAGYRPFTEEELKGRPSYGSVEWDVYTQSLKDGPELAHIDLCGFQELKKRDRNNVCYDEVLIKAIPYIVEVSSTGSNNG